MADGKSLDVYNRFSIAYTGSNWLEAKKASIEGGYGGRARIIADKTNKFSVNPLYPRHQRSINPRTDETGAISISELSEQMS
jgi:hypothetical protein